MGKLINKFTIVAAILLVAFFVAGLQAAPINETGYNQLKPQEAAPAVLHSTASSADSKDWTTTPVNPIATDGNPNLTLRVDFSVATATATVACGLYHKTTAGTYTFLGISAVTTVTASGSAGFGTIGSRYASMNPASFDTKAAPYVDLRVLNISTGNVTTRPWLYGSATKDKN